MTVATALREIILLRLDLELVTPGGVAAPESLADHDVGIDLPLSRDGWNQPYVPATSLAGSLRACALRLGRDPDQLFGYVRQTLDPATGKFVTETAASPARFLGTTLTLPDTAEPTSRTRNVIDRKRGATAPTLLWRGELLPAGTRVTCYLRLDDPGLLVELLAVVAAWQPHIGAGRSVGRGQARLIQVRRRTIDLTTAPGLRAWLTGGGHALFADADTTPVDLPVTEPEAEVLRSEWEIVDGLHIGTGKRDEAAITGAERASAPALLLRSAGTPCVPGSTWKGILRSRCEYILRSLGVRACHSSDPENRCHAEPVCLACRTFGWTGRDDEAPGPGEAKSVGHRSRLLFADSLITDARVVIRQHVALDRMTGGARDGQLFAHEVAEAGRLILEITIADDLEPAARALLTLALADLHDGYLAVGAASTRGIGTLHRTDAAGEDITRERRTAAQLLAASLEGTT